MVIFGVIFGRHILISRLLLISIQLAFGLEGYGFEEFFYILPKVPLLRIRMESLGIFQIYSNRKLGQVSGGLRNFLWFKGINR